MLNLTETLLSFLLNKTEGTPIVRITLDSIINEPKSGIDSIEHDLTEFVTSFGGTSKELQLIDGVYRPGSHSFELANTADIGDFLFTLRRNLALNSWINKSYYVKYGFRNHSGIEELFNVYRGIISAKVEDRISDKVNVNSNDSLRLLNDYKFCVQHNFKISNYFSVNGYRDLRTVQPVIRMGVFKLDTTQDVWPLTEGMGNDSVSDSYSVQPNNYWMFPFENLCRIDAVYFYDYKDSLWKLIPGALYLSDITLGYKNYRLINITNLTTTLITGQTASWTDYKNGTNYFSGVEVDSRKIQVACATHTNSVYFNNTHNPIGAVLEILKLTGVATNLIDVSASPIVTIDITKTFDYAYQKHEQEGINVNTKIDSLTSALSIIQEIGKLTAFVVYYSADFSSTERRNYKLALDRFMNTCKDNPIPFQLATNDNLLTFIVEQNSDELYSGVALTNYEEGFSTKDSFDIISKGDATDILNGQNIKTIGSENHYFFNNTIQGKSIAQRLYNEYKIPVERYSVSLDKMGSLLEIGDYVTIYDHKTRESVIGRINNLDFDLWNRTSLRLKRYSKLYGPFGPYAVWAFCDCALAGTNGSGGSGSLASISSGSQTVTFGDGSTSGMASGMYLRIGGTNGGTSGTEIFEIDIITSNVTLTVKTPATINHTNVSWSAGKGYFVR